MKLILKILAAPVILFLTVAVWLCVLLVSASAYILGFAGVVVGIVKKPVRDFEAKTQSVNHSALLASFVAPRICRSYILTLE